MNDNVGELLEQRGNQWGDAIGTHVRIAKVWDAIANREEITALKVALMMQGLKIIRSDINPDDPDSFNDDEGYGRIAQLIAGHRTSLDNKSEFVQQAHAAVKEIIDPDSPCMKCPHPISAHRDPSGTLGSCQAFNREGPGDVRYCRCLFFQRH